MEPKDVDRYVGTRVRERRIMLGLTQQQLADLIGVTYQQAHKYERGINRISAGRLYGIAKALGVPVSFFFDGVEDGSQGDLNPRQRLCLEVARNFAMIPDQRHQEALSRLARALAETPPQTEDEGAEDIALSAGDLEEDETDFDTNEADGCPPADAKTVNSVVLS